MARTLARPPPAATSASGIICGSPAVAVAAPGTEEEGVKAGDQAAAATAASKVQALGATPAATHDMSCENKVRAPGAAPPPIYYVQNKNDFCANMNVYSIFSKHYGIQPTLFMYISNTETFERPGNLFYLRYELTKKHVFAKN